MARLTQAMGLRPQSCARTRLGQRMEYGAVPDLGVVPCCLEFMSPSLPPPPGWFRMHPILAWTAVSFRGAPLA